MTVGTNPEGVAVNPTGTRVYVANLGSNSVSVINASTNTVIGSPVPVGNNPVSLGQFIRPASAVGGVAFFVTPGGGLVGEVLVLAVAGGALLLLGTGAGAVVWRRRHRHNAR